MPFPAADVVWFERALLTVASGYRKHTWARGAWNGESGISEEPITVYVSTVEAKQLAAIFALLDRACQVFRQEAVYSETSFVERQLLTASVEPVDAAPSGAVSVSRH